MSPAELNHILNALSNKDIRHTPQTDCVDTHHPGAYYPKVRTICVFWYNYCYLRTIHRCVLYPAKYGISVAPKNGGKQPAQTKRKRATKTTTVNKKHKL